MSEEALPPRLPLVDLRSPAGGGAGAPHKCTRCAGACCSYLALQIDSPRSWDDFEDIRWYVSHLGVQVFKDGRCWFLQVQTRCRHLDGTGRCGIYERRPRICREHRLGDCEFENPAPLAYAVHFEKGEDVERYMRRRWPRGRSARRAQPRRPLRAPARGAPPAPGSRRRGARGGSGPARAAR